MCLFGAQQKILSCFVIKFQSVFVETIIQGSLMNRKNSIDFVKRNLL